MELLDRIETQLISNRLPLVGITVAGGRTLRLYGVLLGSRAVPVRHVRFRQHRLAHRQFLHRVALLLPLAAVLGAALW